MGQAKQRGDFEQRKKHASPKTPNVSRKTFKQCSILTTLEEMSRMTSLTESNFALYEGVLP